MKNVMEGFFFEINQALSNTIMAIGANNLNFAIKYIKRLKALIKPSGIFDEITSEDKIMYGDRDKYIERQILSRCDDIIKSLGQAKSGSKLDLKNILTHISSLVFSINKYYMYAKTKVEFAGSYKPAFDVFDKEGVE